LPKKTGLPLLASVFLSFSDFVHQVFLCPLLLLLLAVFAIENAISKAHSVIIAVPAAAAAAAAAAPAPKAAVQVVQRGTEM
jgi:hypothetical protein